MRGVKGWLATGMVALCVVTGVARGEIARSALPGSRATGRHGAEADPKLLEAARAFLRAREFAFVENKGQTDEQVAFYAFWATYHSDQDQATAPHNPAGRF